MTNSKLFILLLVLFCSGVALAQKPETPAYRSYCNSRFDYCISYPSAILAPQPEAENGDGRKFLSRDNEVEMLVYGGNNALDETLAGKYADETVSASGRTITYKLKKDNWFVVSGINNARVFYHKIIFRNGQFLTFAIEYPAGQRRIMDAVTAKIAASFK